jgi:hypothetical protein
MRLRLLWRSASLVVTCCINALKMAMFALFDAADCERTEAARLAMWILIDSTMVLAVPLSNALS